MSAIVRRGLGTIGLVLLSATVVGAQSPASSPQAPAAQKPPPGSQSGAPDARELANQVNNPAAPVTLIQFRNLLFPSVEGTDGATNAFEIQPVMPLGPFASFPHLQLIKITLPFPSLPSPVSAAGVGDLQVFDLVAIKDILGTVGPWTSPGVSHSIRQGARCREVAGRSSRRADLHPHQESDRRRRLSEPDVLCRQLGSARRQRPDHHAGVTYNLEDGWFAGLSDYDWEFDWKHGGDATILLGVQVGRVFHIGHQAFSASIEVGGAVAKPSTAPSPGWIIGFEFSPIFKGHIK